MDPKVSTFYPLIVRFKKSKTLNGIVWERQLVKLERSRMLCIGSLLLANHTYAIMLILRIVHLTH